MKSGFVGLIGRPNVGKSSLINTIVKEKIAIISDKPQTTRNMIQGIYNDEETQIVFVDTPGIHKPVSKLGKHLNKQAYYSINDVDVIVLLVDISEKLGPGDKFVIAKLNEVNKPVILVLNKIDKMPKPQILSKIDEYKDLYNFDEIVPLSALKNDNVDRLITVIKKYLKDEIKYYSDDQVTDKSINFRLVELVREKVLELTREEIPHAVTCLLDELKEEEKVFDVSITIVVERPQHKKIILGKQGIMIKEIGTRARLEMEKILGKRVYLNLFVKVIPKWREKESILFDLGFNDYE